jgi:SUN domain-containing protein 1/2
LREYRLQKVAKRKEELEAAGEVLDEEWEKRELEREREGYPATLPKNPEYLRIAKFTYDIHASQNVQTFEVDPEVKGLGVDFGVVVARVLNNWGQDSYTCLYRIRVHGRMLGELPAPYSEPTEEQETLSSS